jgi:hypothetical protein
MRYVVDPKKRRAASTFLYRAIFDEVKRRQDIEIGSDTQTVTYRQWKPQSPEHVEEDESSRQQVQAREQQAHANYDEQSLPGQLPEKDKAA